MTEGKKVKNKNGKKEKRENDGKEGRNRWIQYLKERKISSSLEENENIRSRSILQAPSSIQLVKINWVTHVPSFHIHLTLMID